MARPWMPFYVAEYLGDTGHLNTTQHGAYLLLILHYWRKGGLPDDDRQLANIAKLPLRLWQDIRPIMQDFFFDGWKHKRVEFELSEAVRIATAGKRGGEASGRSRRSRIKENYPIMANHPSTTVERSANDLRSPYSHKERVDVGGDARASPGCAITPEAFALCDELMRLQRLEKDDPRCIASAYAVQAWLTKGWKYEVIRSTVDIVMSKRADAPSALRYFEKAIAAAHAEFDRPLPVAVIQEEKPHVVRKTVRPRGALDAAADYQRHFEGGADSSPDSGAVVGLPARRLCGP